MRIGSQQLTYCLNVHPGNSLEDIQKSITTYVLPLKKELCPNAPFGLGLRIAHEASLELSEPTALHTFKLFLDEHQLYCFTINAFPYADFHTVRVKEKVYTPDWRDPKRYDYTLRIAHILAYLAPENSTTSISTVPLAYKKSAPLHQQLDESSTQLLRLVHELQKIKKTTGKTICLALEPEPDCTLETTQECINFFKLLHTKSKSYHISEPELQQHLGICFDTCHLALQFEDLSHSLSLLINEGITIAKIQLSSALRVTPTPAAFAELNSYCDAVYLHQVKIQQQGSRCQEALLSYKDLPLALEEHDYTNGDEMRIHFHLPLYFEGTQNLQATNHLLDATFFQTAKAHGILDFEIETYTFDVLPRALQERGLIASLIDEYHFVQERL